MLRCDYIGKRNEVVCVQGATDGGSWCLVSVTQYHECHSAGNLIFQNEITFNKKYNLPFIYRADTILKNMLFFETMQEMPSICKAMVRNFQTLS